MTVSFEGVEKENKLLQLGRCTTDHSFETTEASWGMVKMLEVNSEKYK